MMYNYVKQLANQLENINLEKCFEVEVLNSKGERDYICCDIFFRGNSLVAQRDAVSSKEEASKYIAESRIVCNDVFSLDEHIQELHSAVIQDIIDGDLYYAVAD